MGIPLRALVSLAVALVLLVAVVIGLGSLAWGDPPAAATQAPLVDANGKKTLAYYVTVSLTQAFDELGMGAAEKKLFETDVLNDGMLFVTSYNTTHEGTDVQVDRQKLKNYLRFQPALFAEAPICVVVRAQPGCENCEKLQKKMSDGLLNRLSRRGFDSKPGPAASEEQSLFGDKAFDYFAAKSTEAGCGGLAYAELTQTEEDEETGRLHVTGFITLKNRAGKKVRTKAAMTATSASDDRTAHAITSKQAADLFSGVAAQSSSVAAVQASDSDERYLRLDGVANFGVYAKFKSTVAAAMPELKFEERFIMPGQVQFAILSDTSLAQLASDLKQLSWGGQKLEVTQSTSTELAVMLK